MSHQYSASLLAEQVESDERLEEIFADLTLDFPKVDEPVVMRGAMHPLWRAYFDREQVQPRAAAPAAANDDEVPLELPAPANDDAPVLVPELVTKAPSRRRRRRSGLRQGEDARRMRAHGRVAKREAVENLTPSHSNDNTTSNSSTIENIPTNDNTPTTKTKARRRGLASWEDAGELPQVIAINRGLSEFGVPYAFSFNLHPDLIQAANENERGQLDFYRRRMALTVKRELGRTLPFWIAIETDDEGRQHCHGGIALNDNLDLREIEPLLAKAGGNYSTQGSKPADVRAQHDLDGWAVYPFKRVGRTRRDLRQAAGLPNDARVTVWSATNDLRAAGKRIHEATRRAIMATEAGGSPASSRSHPPSHLRSLSGP